MTLTDNFEFENDCNNSESESEGSYDTDSSYYGDSDDEPAPVVILPKPTPKPAPAPILETKGNAGSKYTSMMFCNKGVIDVSKIPKYTEFNSQVFHVPCDRRILRMLSKDPRIHPSEQGKLLKLLAKIDKHGNLKTKYEHRGEAKQGRFYPKDDFNIILCCKLAKHTMFKFMGYKDIDMCVGHPSIVASLGEKIGIKFPAVSEYIERRDEIVKDVCEYYSADPNNPLDEGDGKELFNIHIYGGGLAIWRQGVEEGEENKGKPPKPVADKPVHPFVARFIEDRDTLMEWVYQNNNDLFRRVQVSHPDLSEEEAFHKNKRTMMSTYLTIYENHVIYLTFKFLREQKIISFTRVALEYDGLCIPPNENTNYDEKEVLDALHKELYRKTGLKYVRMAFKEPKCALNDIVEKRIAMGDEKMTTSDEGVFDDAQAAKRVLELYPHWVYCENKLYVFDKTTGMWNSDQSQHNRVIMSLSEHLHLMQTTPDGDAEKSKTSYGNTYRLMTILPNLIKTHCQNDDWLKQTDKSALGKLLFKNGWLDCKTMTFHDNEVDPFDPAIVFWGRIHNDWTETITEEDKTYMKDVKKRLFYDTLDTAVGDCFILHMARGLAGDMMKKIIFAISGTNTGKTTLTKAIMLSCGDYAGSFNAENMIYRNSSNDEAQLMRWALLLRYKRLIFSNELRTTSNGSAQVNLSGTIIKKSSSGGDTCVGRMHGGNETEFVPHFLATVFANDMGGIKPYDDAVAKRRIQIPMNKECVDHAPVNKLQLQKDYKLDTEMQTERFQKVMIRILMEEYQKMQIAGKEPPLPQEVQVALDDWKEEDSTPMVKFLEDYELTNDTEDIVKSSDLEAWLTSLRCGFTYKKFCSELKRHLIIKDFTNVVNKGMKNVKTGGRNVQVWVGMKLKPDDEVTEEPPKKTGECKMKNV